MNSDFLHSLIEIRRQTNSMPASFKQIQVDFIQFGFISGNESNFMNQLQLNLIELELPALEWSRLNSSSN